MRLTGSDLLAAPRLAWSVAPERSHDCRPGDFHSRADGARAASIASGLNSRSLRIVPAVARKPCVVISSAPKPMRRSAELRAFSERGRCGERMDGKISSLAVESGYASLSTLSAWSRAACCLRAFVRSAGMRQTCFFNGDLVAPRSANCAGACKGEHCELERGLNQEESMAWQFGALRDALIDADASSEKTDKAAVEVAALCTSCLLPPRPA